MTCAFSGAFLLFGGFAAISWGKLSMGSTELHMLMVAGFLRSLSIHLQICWQVVPGKKFFWGSLLAGWGIPALIVAIALPVTGTSYRFGNTCHINHTKALDDYWGPLLAFAAISTVLQFATFGYCIRVYIKSLFNDSNNSTSQVSSQGLPSYTSQAGSVKTVTAGQAYRRVKKVIALQWRGTLIVLIIIVNVVFLAVVFVQMDNTVTAAMQDLGKAEPWLLCLVMNGGDKTSCLGKVKAASLVTNEATLMAVLILLSVRIRRIYAMSIRLTLLQLNGIWTMVFLGRTSMLIGWIDLFRKTFSKRHTDFASVDARRFSNSPKTYEMITAAPPRTADDTTIKAPEPVITSPPPKEEYGLSPLAQSPRSPSSHYTNSVDYFDKILNEYQSPNYGKEADYKSPKLSFSKPRPPSAGGPFSKENVNTHKSFSPRMEPVPQPGRDSPTSTYSNPHTSRGSGPRSFSPAYEWDPTATYASPSQRHDPFKL